MLGEEAVRLRLQVQVWRAPVAIPGEEPQRAGGQLLAPLQSAEIAARATCPSRAASRNHAVQELLRLAALLLAWPPLALQWKPPDPSEGSTNFQQTGFD